MLLILQSVFYIWQLYISPRHGLNLACTPNYRFGILIFGVGIAPFTPAREVLHSAILYLAVAFLEQHAPKEDHYEFLILWMYGRIDNTN